MNQNVFKIKPTKITPSVLIDKEQFLIQVMGCSYPEDPLDSYKQILDWLTSLGDNIDRPLTCEFYFSFLNSTSHKMVFDILYKLQNLHQKGNPVSVFWYYADGDDDILEKGEDFMDILKLPVQIVSKEVPALSDLE